MTQTLAIFLDAYRELNARRLFWLTLALSGLVVVSIAMLGIDRQGVWFLLWRIPLPWQVDTSIIPRELFYKWLFNNVGLGMWLTWIAGILAVVSTAGIFPDFLAGGSVELFLSRPLGRLRLFLAKYLSGLLFVALQVGVFCGCSFLVIGLRGGSWVPGVFLGIPLVVLFFSYLFAVCVLLGVLTRSTVAAALLTLLFWGGIFAVHSAEVMLLQAQVNSRLLTQRYDRQIEGIQQEIRRLEEIERSGPPATRSALAPLGPRELREMAQHRLRFVQQKRRDVREFPPTPHRILMNVKTVLPKTAETVALMNRWLIAMADLPGGQEPARNSPSLPLFEDAVDSQSMAHAMEQELRSRSIAWVLGTSLAFEAAVLAIAAWIFCRRDY